MGNGQLKSFGILIALALLLLCARAASAAPPPQTRDSTFQSVACSTFKINSNEFQCGYVTVPELHAEPNGKQIKLGVAILPSTGQTPTQNAYVMAQGGPGGSTIDTYSQLLQLGLFPSLRDLRAERDIVLYDQRGTLYAQPNLKCPEELDNTFRTIEQIIPYAQQEEQSQAASLACRARLLSQGVNLAAYNSIENALDIKNVRDALGYQQFDYYGVSYGTLLALHGMQETPESFRTVILDSVVPPQINPNTQVAATENRAFEKLFATCAADADCNRAYPNLKQVFYSQVDALNTTPARVPITDNETGITYNSVLDGNTFIDLTFQLSYDSDVIPSLPSMIYHARDGRYTLLQAFQPILTFDRTFASGMYYSVTCAEDANFTIDDLALDGVDPHIAGVQTRETAALLSLCQKWGVPQLGAQANAPVSSVIPTLLFSGEFDPITPPPYAQAAAQTIKPSYPLVFPAYGHGSETSGDCPNQIIVEFITDPRTAPNAQCIASVAQVPFVTPAKYLLSSNDGLMRFQILGGKIQPFILPLICIGVLLSVILVEPVAWVVRLIRKRPTRTKLAGWLAAISAALAGLTAASFALALFGVLVYLALRNENTTALILGFPRQYGFVYVIPPIYLVFALALILVVALVWIRGEWLLLRRIYYALLALSAFGLTVWLFVNGALTMFFG